MNGPSRWVCLSMRCWSRATAVEQAQETTPVGCWGGDVIYVDPQATGAHTGTNWQDAYTHPQEALARAAKGCGTKGLDRQGNLYTGRQRNG